MVSTQANNSLGILAAQAQDVRDAAWRVGATIDQVAKKNQSVGVRVAWQHVEQAEELGAATVYVTHDECFH